MSDDLSVFFINIITIQRTSKNFIEFSVLVSRRVDYKYFVRQQESSGGWHNVARLSDIESREIQRMFNPDSTPLISLRPFHCDEKSKKQQLSARGTQISESPSQRSVLTAHHHGATSYSLFFTHHHVIGGSCRLFGLWDHPSLTLSSYIN
jgi:hypothetical protein